MVLLLAALTEPVDVRILDDDPFPWFEVLGPLAIIIGAGIATWWNRKNHVETIQNSNDRLERELAHDRKMRELEATREMLDELGILMTGIIDATGDFSGAVRHRSSMREQAERATTPEERVEPMKRAAEAQKRVNDSLEPAYKAVNEGRAARFRLLLRFPYDDPLVSAFNDWHQAIEAWLDEVREAGGGDILTEEEMKRQDELAGVASTALLRFTEAAQSWTQRIELPD